MGTPIGDDQITVSDETIDAPGAVQPVWTGLERRADASFFLSWHWIGTWLSLIPGQCKPRLVTARKDGKTVGLAVLTGHQQKHRLFIRTNALSLHEAAVPGYNMVIEHNGFLVRRGLEREASAAMLRHIHERFTDHDELYLGAIRRDQPLYEIAVSRETFPISRILQEAPSPYVDLERLRESGTDYLSALSRNARHQLRRDLRAARQHGELQLDEASSTGEALECLERMKPLHQRHWQRRALPGSFANPRWEEFHRGLIEDAFPGGHIQLLTVRAGPHVLGYLYNFLYAGRACALQSGFDYDFDPELRPGYISHYLAIEHNLARDATAYDFLMGDARYKRTLATGKNMLVWLVLQRPRMTLRIENVARSIYNAPHYRQYK